MLCAYLILLLCDLSVPQPTDHSRYMDAARTFPAAPKDPIFNHQYLRIGLIAPTALVMKVFGYSEVTYHFVPVAAASLLFASVYAIGCLLFSRLVGAVSAIVLSCLGIIVVAGTELLPDLPATALFTAAVALAIGIRRGHRFVARRRLALLLIGVLLGWSYLTREFIVFVWPLVPALMWRRIKGSESLELLVPLVLVLGGELALNAVLYHDPLERLHASSGLGDLPSAPDVATTFHDLPLWEYLWRLPQQLGRQAAGWGLWLLLAATLVGGVMARRRLGVFAVWVLLLWVPLTLLGGVLDPAHPKLRLQLLRYWYPVFPAFVIGGVAACWVLVRHPVGRRVLVSAVGVLMVAFAVAGWAGSARLSPAGGGALPQFRAWLSAHRHSVRAIWADTKLYRVIPIYFEAPFGGRVWHGSLRGLTSPAAPVPGDYVVAYSIGSDACPLCGQAARALLGPGPPASWQLVFTSHDHLLQVWRVSS